jgi:hypothetical protein
VSSAAARAQAYEAFLGTCDLTAWSTSFDAFREILEGSRDVRDASPLDIRRALTVAIYFAWLSGQCGDDEGRRRANASLDALSTTLAHAPEHVGPEAILIRAVIAAVKGYRAVAARILKGYGAPAPVEVALLAVPERSTPRAGALKTYVIDGFDRPFIPAIYYFGSALLELGYQSSVEQLLTRHPAIWSSSPGVDLGGQLRELGGSWRAARDLYSQSDWSSHAYRLAVCNLILGESVDRLAASPPDAVKKFTAGMLEFSGEVDRAGVFRSAAFVHACRSSGFDNWLVHFELGRLGFQRRRHAEAEKHFAAAARTAPAQFRFPIHSIRFTNLTWLRDAMDVPMSPEAMEAGYAAMQEAPGEEQCAHIRTWIGQFEGESEFLEPAAISDDFERGNAHQIRGNVPDALACWCSCVAARYTPRAFFDLLRIFASYGFERTSAALAGIAELESQGNFFDLWELAGAIAGVLQKQPPGRIAGDLLKERLERVEARIEELVESEFQNAIRAFHYFFEQRRLSPALRMIARAERLAEGSEELLLLAIARRKAAGGGWDPRGLEALRRAQRQSTNRFERLVIARELVTFGDLTAARAILSDEGAFSGRGDFTPIEYVVALQCAKVCCGEEQRKLLEASARESLKRDVEAGRFLRHGDRFLKRLNDHLAAGALEIAFARRESVGAPGLSSWHELVQAIERLQSGRQAGQELRLLNDQVEAQLEAGSLFARFALWGLHLDRFDAHLGMIDRLRPTVADYETPMARDLSPVRMRARQVTSLWRAHLLTGDPVDAERLLARIRTFFEEEKQLGTRWQKLRNLDAEEPSNRALAYAKQGARLLEDIASDDGSAALWPPFLHIDRAVVTDAGELAVRLHTRAGSIRESILS